MMENTLHYLTVGALLGLSAGVSPGPLLTLVLTQTIKHNRTEGIKVAMSPLITDLPIILMALFVFSRIAEFDTALGIISIVGGVFVVYLGIESIKSKGINLDLQGSKSESIKKGIIANFLSPSPYLFWATVGTPLIFKAFGVSLLTAVLFLTAFYALLIGSKITIAIVVSRTKVFIRQNTYVLIMRFLGVVLLLFSILFFYDGITYLN